MLLCPVYFCYLLLFSTNIDEFQSSFSTWTRNSLNINHLKISQPMIFFQIVKQKLHHAASHNALCMLKILTLLHQLLPVPVPQMYSNKNISSVYSAHSFCVTSWENVINNGWIDCISWNVSVLVTNRRVPTAVVIHPHSTHQHRFQLQQAGVFSRKQKDKSAYINLLNGKLQTMKGLRLVNEYGGAKCFPQDGGDQNRAKRREEPEIWSKIPTGADVSSTSSQSCPHSLMCAFTFLK